MASMKCRFCDLVGPVRLENDLKYINYDLNLTKKQKEKFQDEEVQFLNISLAVIAGNK